MAVSSIVKSQEKLKALKALERNGRIDTVALIQAASHPDHPCHNDFTWDDAKAAEERRHDQARALIRSFRFEIEVVDIGSVRVPTYVSVDVDDGCEFRSMASVRKSEDVRSVFDSEIRQLLGVASRVAGIAEAKRAHVGDETVNKLRGVCKTLSEMLGDE